MLSAKFDRKSYMRDYMRRRRGSTITQRSPDWLRTLRRKYRDLLARQREAGHVRDAATLLGAPADLPPHIARALADADAALDRHAALHPELAAEYFARHAANDLLRDADRADRALRALTQTRRPRGRPPTTGNGEERLRAARRALATAERNRAEAYEAHQRALTLDLDARTAARIQSRLDRARTHAETLHRRVAAMATAHENRARLTRSTTQEADALRAQRDALRAEAQALLAPLPNPPRAPLHEAAPERIATVRRPPRRRAAPTATDPTDGLA